MKRMGRYEIVEELGRGAMGVVYRASDPTIGRLVALKLLSLDPSARESTSGAQEDFRREVQAAGRLTHPSIVTIHDAFEEPEEHLSCIVMELVEGSTLERFLLENRLIATGRALKIARQVAEGLDYAHRQRVIHCDLKPANILVTADGRAKIADFGIAKITARENAARTYDVTGTPPFMSPEQVKGEEMDARSDLFSFGIILYLLLTGQKPFSGDPAAVMFKIAYEDPILPSSLNARLTAAHDYVILRCLVKDRDKRYSSAREILNDLSDLEAGEVPRTQATSSQDGLRTAERTIISGKPEPLPPPVAATPATHPGIARTATRVWATLALAAVAGVAGWGYAAHSFRLPSSPAVLAKARSAAAVKSTPRPDGSGSKMQGVMEGREAGETPSAVAAASSTKKSSASFNASPQDSAFAATPAKFGTPLAGSAMAGKAAAGGRIIQLTCRHDLKEGTLTITSGGEVIFLEKLKGRKKGGFLGIKGRFTGELATSIQVPPNSSDLTVRVVTADRSTDLRSMALPPPPGVATPTLEVEISHHRLSQFYWRQIPQYQSELLSSQTSR